MKRILALLLSILLMLSFCALGEEAVGQYALSEPTLRLLLVRVWTREPEAVSFVEAIAKNILLELDADGRMRVSITIPNLNQIMPALEKIATGEDSGAKLFWSEDGGRLLLVAHAYNRSASTDLGANLDGDTFSISYGLRFQRVSGENGFAGVWEMDRSLLGQILAQAAAPAEALRLLSAGRLCLSLNEDGTIGIDFSYEIGIYHDGIVEYTESLGQLAGGANGATAVYVLDGDKLTLIGTTVVDGIIQGMTETFYRVPQASD